MNPIKYIELYNTNKGYYDNCRPDRVVELIEWLQAKLEQVPEEYRNKVCIDLTGGTDAYSSTSDVDECIYYYRPPTPEEIEQDLKDAEARKQKREDQEREEYAKLKAKFES